MQAPFVTVFMYLNEAKNEQEKEDLALIIEEVIEQRYQGVKNEKGAWITPAFPCQLGAQCSNVLWNWQWTYKYRVYTFQSMLTVEVR